MNNTTSRDRRALGFVVLLAALTFVPSLWNEFAYDDVLLIVNRPDIKSLDNWATIVTSGWWPHALYRPLSQLSLAVDWAVGGGAPWYFHLTNVVLHALVTMGVWVLARKWVGMAGATVAGIVFAVHPVHVEAVANVIGRTEIFAGGFAVLAALLYRWDGELADQNPADRRRIGTALGTLACVLLGLASKESAFAIPGVLLLVDWLDSARAGRRLEDRIRAHGFLWAATVVVALQWLLLRSVILGDLAGDDAAPGLLGEGLVSRVLIMAPIVLQYLRLMVFPLHLSADYSPNFVPVTTSLNAGMVAGFVVAGTLAWLAVALRNRSPVTTLGLAWMAGTIFVVSNIILPTGVLIAERSMYLPSIGAALIAGELVNHVWSSRRRAVLVTVVVVAVASLVRVETRIPVWRNNETFAPRLVLDAPGSFRSFWIAGQLRFVQGRHQEGEALIREALRIYPFFANTWQSLGQRLQEQSRFAESGAAFNIAFRLRPARIYDAAAAVSNYARAGLIDSAQAVADSAFVIDPYDHRLLASFGDLARARNRHLEAMTWMRQAALWSGASPQYWYLDGLAALRAGYCPELARAVNQIAKIDTSFADLAALRDSLETGCIDDEH